MKLDDSIKNNSSFECMSVLLQSSSYVLHFIILYRPLSAAKNKIQKASFIEEFDELLELAATMSGKLIIAGDFNIHMDKLTDTECSQLSSLIDFFGLVQHVSGSTHIKGHTLDLVISMNKDIIQGCTLGSFISGHNAIHFNVKSEKEHSSRKSATTEKLKSINPDEF